jgi:hypothetical protein
MYPHERSLVKKLEGKPFALLGVNSDQDKGKLRQSMAKEGLTWRSWWDGQKGGPIATGWNVHEWPTVYVLDAAGVIRFKGAAHEKVLDEAVDRLLRETNGTK